MRNVTKDASPAIFEEWKAAGNPDWSPCYGDLQRPEKPLLHEALLVEQGWTCCYCGREVTREDSHIEHFRPQEGYENLALSYENLHASCIRETAPGMPLHCGHAKGGQFDEAGQICPLDLGCEDRFMYTFVGDVTSADPDDAAAIYMIGLLQLDIPFLRNRREEALRLTYSPNFLSTVTADELRLLRDAFRQRDAHGRITNFGHVLARYAEQRLSEV